MWPFVSALFRRAASASTSMVVGTSEDGPPPPLFHDAILLLPAVTSDNRILSASEDDDASRRSVKADCDAAGGFSEEESAISVCLEFSGAQSLEPFIRRMLEDLSVVNFGVLDKDVLPPLQPGADDSFGGWFNRSVSRSSVASASLSSETDAASPTSWLK